MNNPVKLILNRPIKNTVLNMHVWMTLPSHDVEYLANIGLRGFNSGGFHRFQDLNLKPEAIARYMRFFGVVTMLNYSIYSSFETSLYSVAKVNVRRSARRNSAAQTKNI